MSITKGAIGLCYLHHGVDTSQPLWPAWGGCKLTLEHCLNHHAGMHDDDGKHTFDYDEFREAVKSNATDYSEKLLRRRKGTPGEFGYSNLGWQLLAYRFEEITGFLPSTALASIIGTEGWTWETDKSGHCLGPHGLEMTKNAAIRLGTAAEKYFKPQDFVLTTPLWFWNFNTNEALGRRYVYHGWFSYKTIAGNPVFLLYAAGFMLQYIVVTKNDVQVQLRGSKQSDFDNEPSQQHSDFFDRIVQNEAAT
jgi:hypothetical protein